MSSLETNCCQTFPNRIFVVGLTLLQTVRSLTDIYSSVLARTCDVVRDLCSRHSPDCNLPPTVWKNDDIYKQISVFISHTDKISQRYPITQSNKRKDLV